MTTVVLKPLLLSLGLLALPGASSPRHHGAAAVFAGGCFWGVEYVFEHVRGVESVISGFAREPGSTQPIEAVYVTYNADMVTYKQLLEVFFAVAHDPTTQDRQGPDVGPEYRAVVFTRSPTEVLAALQHVAELNASKKLSGPIVTLVRPLDRFTAAEKFHQDYSVRHLTDAYVVQNDIPKLERLKREFPALYQEQRAP